MLLNRFISVVVIIVTFHITSHTAQDQKADNPCTKLVTCSECTQNPECGWCSFNEQPKSLRNANPRCDLANNHLRCKGKDPFVHANYVHVSRTGSVVGISSGPNFLHPQQISAKLRVRDPINITITYTNVEGYPLELYYLMDGTLSMVDDKNVLVNLEDSIGESLRSLTSSYKQGFGTFVDKPTMPFSARLPRGITCKTKNDTICVPPYSFKNRIPITSETAKFSEAMGGLDLAPSSDIAEGGLDALMQVMVCENQIGWSKSARRMIIFATDGIFHYAGDGRLGGILAPNDGLCHLDSTGEYTHSTLLDYPSFAQINSKAKRHSARIIFAVTADSINDYKLLAESIEGAVTVELEKDSSNIVKLVKETYESITSSVELRDTFPFEYFRVAYFSSCEGENAERETRKCDVLKGEVQFRIEIELLKCPPREEWKTIHSIYPVGIQHGVEIDIEALCSCPCGEAQNHIPYSKFCNGVGTEVCGLCECNAGYYGEQCQCSSTSSTKEDDSRACMGGNSTEQCSGRGNCLCGQCSCLDKRYSGSYCECDNESCFQENGELCAGNGKCDCGTCVCNPGWSGDSCGCSTNKETCVEPGTYQECNRRGECSCGKCECESRFRGDFCEKCRVESCQRCDEIKHCVQCKLFGTGTLDASHCETECDQYDISRTHLVNASTGDSSIVCKFEDPADECVVVFSYEQTGRIPLKIQGQVNKECPPKAPIYWIAFGVTSLVVIIGLIIFCVFKFLRRIRIKREYAKYKKDVDNLDWGRAQEKNPLYHDPIGTFQNPTYRGKDS